jgi:fatty-acyl-CoA synthase
VVTHHRGAYLNAVCNAATWTMPHFPVYLWTLPMFHCNGWCFPWTVAMLGGTHVCLRRVEAKAILDAMREHGVDHYCAAPIVHSLIYNAPDCAPASPEGARHGGRRGAAGGHDRRHGEDRLRHHPRLRPDRGLRPGRGGRQAPAWAGESLSEQTRLNGRQGVRYMLQEGMTVLDPETMAEVPADGQTMGEIMFRGNIVMKGYLKNPAATDKAFEGGWFHTGDLAVMEPDRYVKIKDRSKDVIISGGENISSASRSKTRCTATRPCWPAPWWRGPTPSGAKRRWPIVELKPGATVSGRRTGGPLQGPAGRLQGAARDPLRAHPQDQHRQDPEVPVARTRPKPGSSTGWTWSTARPPC